MARQERHAVESLLADDLGLVAGGLDFQPRELRLLRLDLLQHDDVGLGALEPGEKIAGPLADRVDVPRCDFHHIILPLKTKTLAQAPDASYISGYTDTH